MSGLFVVNSVQSFVTSGNSLPCLQVFDGQLPEAFCSINGDPPFIWREGRSFYYLLDRYLYQDQDDACEAQADRWC